MNNVVYSSKGFNPYEAMQKMLHSKPLWKIEKEMKDLWEEAPKNKKEVYKTSSETSDVVHRVRGRGNDDPLLDDFHKVLLTAQIVQGLSNNVDTDSSADTTSRTENFGSGGESGGGGASSDY